MSAHFLPVKHSYSAEEYVKLYDIVIVKLHGDQNVKIFGLRSPIHFTFFEFFPNWDWHSIKL